MSAIAVALRKYGFYIGLTLLITGISYSVSDAQQNAADVKRHSLIELTFYPHNKSTGIMEVTMGLFNPKLILNIERFLAEEHIKDADPTKIGAVIPLVTIKFYKEPGRVLYHFEMLCHKKSRLLYIL